MDVSPENFRRHFESLSDEALLAVDREELVDLARQYYEAELARRRLPRPVRPVPLQADDLNTEEWVSIADYAWGNAAEAPLAEALLRSEAIPCYMKNENVMRIEPPLSDAWGGGLNLMVPASFADQAREILNSRISEAELEAQAEKSERD